MLPCCDTAGSAMRRWSGTDADADGIVTLSYNYTIGGVDYQSFQPLDAEQLSRKHNYLPGARVQLRYDPQRPANSVVV